MRAWKYGLVTALIVANVTFPAMAWGPLTQQAVVTTAMHVVSKEGTTQLAKLDADIRRGARASVDAFAELYPSLASGPVRAIESEMYLLQAVRGESVDPYFAYRLGVLGSLVAQITAPLLDEDPTYRDVYYRDVDAHIRQVALRASPRTTVDPMPYFERVKLLANTRKEMIIKDYQEGTGFNGVARSALPEDTGRSVSAVADVWHTILTGRVAPASVSQDQKRDYVLAAIAFYVERANPQEIESGYRRLSRLVPKTPDMQKRIGDMFYEAGLYERAVAEYRDVLRADPTRKDVIERIAAYYVKTGDDWLKQRRLEQALEAYADAARVDPLHPNAEAKRLQVERMIAERDARLEATRRSLEEAQSLMAQADESLLRKEYGAAVKLFKEAEAGLGTVTDEFMMQYREAGLNMTTITDRLRQIRNELVGNAQNLSGSAFTAEARRLAQQTPEQLEEEALKSLLTKQYRSEISRLKKDLAGAFDIK